ncbi:MAG TPA: NAD-dependent epimerase/dehydratase family protein [Paucimonas sp.]|nr:NAD-dependent epimerase/dehydratase family protein [Paucimonas sp.]
MKPKKVLVTGGNGHVGNTLAKMLCDKGYEVRATVRNPAEAEAFGIFDGYPVEIHQADMRDEKAMRKAMDGVSGVFQVAALYNYDEQGLGEGIVANNTEGSQTVLRLAKECGVERVVFTSSIAAVGFGGTQERPLAEDDWSNPADPYCRSKLESEQAAWNYAKEHGLDLVVLCPSIILGPNFYKHTPSTVNIAALVNNQIPFRVPVQFAVVDVRDAAEAHVLAYENKEASGRYLIAGTNIPDMVEALSEHDPEMVVPERVLTLDEAKELAEKSGMPLELVGQPYWYSDRRIQSELGWQPRPIAETLRDTIAWIKTREL